MNFGTWAAFEKNGAETTIHFKRCSVLTSECGYFYYQRRFLEHNFRRGSQQKLKKNNVTYWKNGDCRPKSGLVFIFVNTFLCLNSDLQYWFWRDFNGIGISNILFYALALGHLNNNIINTDRSFLVIFLGSVGHTTDISVDSSTSIVYDHYKWYFFLS